MPCLARYTDGVWYRALVTGNSGAQLTVHYIDYGNTSKVSSTSVSSIPLEMVSALPSQAIQCKLNVSSHNRDAIDKFRSLSRDKFRIKVEEVDGNIHYVQAFTLTTPVVNFNSELSKSSKKGWDKKNSNVNNGDVEELYITWVESSNNFYGQLTRLGRQDLQDFLARMSHHCQR